MNNKISFILNHWLIKPILFLWIICCFTNKTYNFVLADSKNQTQFEDRLPATSSAIMVTIPDTSAPPAATINIPIHISDATNIAGFTFKITYNSDILTAFDAVLTDLTENFFIAVVIDSDHVDLDTIGVALTRIPPLSDGNGAIVNLKFRVNAQATLSDTTTIAFTTLALNDEIGNTFEVTGIHGFFIVSPIAVSFPKCVPWQTDIIITTTVSDTFNLQEVNLHYRQGGLINFSSVNMERMTERYAATIPGSNVAERGIEFEIETIDTLNNNQRYGLYNILVALPANQLTKNHFGSTQQTAYRMLSFPLASNPADVNSVLLDDLGTKADPSLWRIWGINPSNAFSEFPYREYPNAGNFAIGKAVFLITNKTRTITNGTGKTVKTIEPFTINLQPGWNMLASPFNFDIPIENVKPDSLQKHFYTYQEKWIPGDSINALQPWEGYMIKNRTNNAIPLTINPSEAVATASKALAKSAMTPDWFLKIKAVNENAEDHDNIVGVINDADYEWDPYERFEPPPIGDFVSLRFVHDDWQRYPDDYTTDFQPSSSQGYSWNFAMKTNILTKPVTLQFDQLESVPEDLSVTLIDPVLEFVQDLRREPHYVFRPAKSGTKHFTLLVEESTPFITRPQTYELAQNFPNPFNPATTIKFGLPEKSRVTLKIYNILGREIATLLNQVEKDAGYKLAVWDGKDQRGNVVPSGVYFYRLQTSEIVMIKKMTLVK